MLDQNLKQVRAIRAVMRDQNCREPGQPYFNMHYLLIGMEIAAKARAGIRPQGLPMLAASGYLNDSMRQAGGDGDVTSGICYPSVPSRRPRIHLKCSEFLFSCLFTLQYPNLTPS